MVAGIRAVLRLFFITYPLLNPLTGELALVGGYCSASL